MILFLCGAVNSFPGGGPSTACPASSKEWTRRERKQGENPSASGCSAHRDGIHLFPPLFHFFGSSRKEKRFSRRSDSVHGNVRTAASMPAPGRGKRDAGCQAADAPGTAHDPSSERAT